MMYIYPAVIHEEDSFWLEFPDLEGCQTCGNTLEETLCNAQEALGLYLASLTENGQTTYISTDINKYRRNTRAVKKMVSLPEWLADEADANNISLSKTLQDALKKRLSIV